MKSHRLLSFALIFSTVSNFDLSSSESVDRDQCGRTYLGRLGSGVIASHNYPFDYRDNLTCIYRIYLDNRANGSSQTTVCLTFRRFSLENSSPFCSFDYVELGSSPPMKYCGTGLWQYGVEKKGNLFSNIWSPNLCWSVQNSDTFDVVFSSDNSINGTGFYANFRVHSSSFTPSVLPSGASDQGPCRLTEWTCFNRKCIAARLLCNGLNECGDWSDESYAHARCKGQNILACDFSDRSVDGSFCSFDHEGWLRSSEVKSSNGPPGDHTNGSNGFYIYSERSSYLVSPQLSLSTNTTYCLSFWYFIYGAAPSLSLSVYVGREQAYSRPEWLRSVDGTTPSHRRWSLGEVPIYAGSSLQIIFASLPLNNESGTALDDFSVTEGSCSGVDISCNFESGFCGWESTSRLSHSLGTWIADHSWQIQSLERGSLGPKSDHSSTDGSGSYLYAEFLAPITPNSKAILVSPAISAVPDEALCLQFWYYAGTRAQSFCLLSIVLHRHDNVLGGEIWSQVPSGNDAWKQANVELEASGPLQVVLLASVKSGNTGIDCGIAVDQLQVLRGRCTTIAAELQAGSTTQTTSIVCPSATSFLCHTSAFCIPRAWLCDLFNDCGDLSDEGPLAGCPVSGDVPMPHPSTFSADKNITVDATALPSARVASTLNMPSCEFSCADGFCVFLSQKCDGVSDCTNGQDEMNCSGFYIPPLTYCQKPSMFCANENLCLSSEFICDGKDDCVDGSDEVGSMCSGKFNYGAVTGIIFGCCFSMLFLLLIALIARRRRKNCSARQPPRPTRQPAHISTVFSVNNQGGGGGISRQIDALSAFVARNGDSEQSRDRNRDNMGYIEEANRDLSGRAFPSEMQVMFGDAPPSYSSVLIDNGELGERRQALLRGNSADELEAQTSSSAAQDNTAVGQSYEPPAGHSRNRRSYRSLPPTPARQPLVSYLQTSADHQPPTSHRRSMLGYGAVSGHDDGRDHHVYEDPSRAMHRQASRSGSQLSGGLQTVNVPGADVFHQSSVISPTLSSQRASRIRLGTMALQNRPGVAHGGQGICSPVCAWQSGLVPDVIGPHSHHGHLCFGDQCDAELRSFESADPGHNFALNELVLLDENSRLMHEHHAPNATRAAHSSNLSSCLSSPMQQNHSGVVGRRDAPNHARASRRHRNSVENATGCGDFVWDGLNTGGSKPVQRREPHYPVPGCDARQPDGFIASNHQRSFSSSEFQDNHLSTDCAGSYLSNCDDRDLSPQMRV